MSILFRTSGLLPFLLSLTASLIYVFGVQKDGRLGLYYHVVAGLTLLAAFLHYIPWYGRKFNHNYGIRAHMGKSFLIHLYTFLIVFLLKLVPQFFWLALPFLALSLFFQYVSFALLYFHFVHDPGMKTPNFLTKA